jgi:hypothetical protein
MSTPREEQIGIKLGAALSLYKNPNIIAMGT